MTTTELNKKETNNDEMISMEDWDGECWKTFFDALSSLSPEREPWDVFAEFMKSFLGKYC